MLYGLSRADRRVIGGGGDVASAVGPGDVSVPLSGRMSRLSSLLGPLIDGMISARRRGQRRGEAATGHWSYGWVR